jgi:hypothetical protein
VENGAGFICVVFWPSQPPEFATRTVVPSIYYSCIRRAGLSVRYKKWCHFMSGDRAASVNNVFSG